LIRLYAIATAAGSGFSVGDKLDLTATVNSFPSGNWSMGLTVTFDSTNIYIRNGTNAALWYIPNKSTGTRDGLGRDNFDLYVEAYA
jgi:DNA-binding beta-propeller fold protein YncE